jgi:hypothetical protein
MKTVGTSVAAVQGIHQQLIRDDLLVHLIEKMLMILHFQSWSGLAV